MIRSELERVGSLFKRSRVWAFGSLLLVIALLAAGWATFSPGVTQATDTQRPLAQDDAVTLTLLHNNDGESGLLPTTNTVDTVDVQVGGIAPFKSVVEREIADATDAGNAVVTVYAGDAFLASATLQCSFPINSDLPVYDAIGQQQIPYTAHILGNHEFDYLPDFLVRFIEGFAVNGALTQPFLSANLDFSGEAGFADLVDEDGLIDGTPTDGRVVARSLIYTDPTTGAAFGIVGATTPALASVSSPRDVQVVADTVQAVQDEIDRLQDQGVTRIVLVSHLQDVENDRALIQQLTGVDLAVAGGGDDFLVNPNVPEATQLLPGQSADEIEGEYPLVETDAAGRTVYLVTSIDKYRFLGRLDVQFDSAGEVTQVVSDESYPRRVVIADAGADSLGIDDAVTPDAALVSSVVEPVQQCLADFAETDLAETEILLDVSRDGVRGGESNAGNLIADAFLDSYGRYAPASGLDPAGADNPVVAIQNGGGIRQNAGDTLPRDGAVPGTITELDTIDVLPFNNFISVVREVTPTKLLEVLDNRGTSGIYQVANLALTYNTVSTGGETTYQIDQILLVTEDGEQPLVADGQPVDGAPSVEVVTNSFVAGREFVDVTDQTFLVDSDGSTILYEQPLREYLQTFPVEDGLPTIQSDDPRYQPGGEGRIVINPPSDGGEGDAVTLTLLHNNDGESTLLPLQNGVVNTDGITVELDVAGVAAFKTLTDNQIAAAQSSGNAVVNVYAGDAFLASAALQCSLDDTTAPVYDAVAQRQIAYDAHIFGNHEFDYSPDFLERFIREFAGDGDLTQPFLSANLDFSGEPGYADLIDEDGLIETPVGDGRVVGRSAIVTDPTTGERFGIVGATTPGLPTVSSPRDVAVTTSTITETATVVQSEIDRLGDAGVTKVIFVSHLQDITNDQALIEQLTGVDVAVAGGGDELLTNPDVAQEEQLLPGEQASTTGSYPLAVEDAAGRTVYIVTTAGNYKYLGRLDVAFDAAGEVTGIVSEQSYPRPVIPTSDIATDLGLTNSVAPDPGIVQTVIEPVQACLEDLSDPIVGSEILLDVSRNGVRGMETNVGNLVADSYLDAYQQLAAANGLPSLDDTNLIAIQNGGGIRQNAGDILPVGGTVPGTISRLDTRNVLAFFNLMTVVEEVTPADLKQIFERSVSTAPDAGGQFLQVAGLTVAYNPANTPQEVDTDGNILTPGNRIISITLADGTPIVADGQVVAGAPNVSIVTNGFTAGGGDNYPALANNDNKTQLFDQDGLALTYEQAWVNYLLTFDETDGLPTIPADDPRYQPGGEGRIVTTDEPGSGGGGTTDPLELSYQCTPGFIDIAGVGAFGLNEQTLGITGEGSALYQVTGRLRSEPLPDSVVFTFDDGTSDTQDTPAILFDELPPKYQAYSYESFGPVGEVMAQVTDSDTANALTAYYRTTSDTLFTGVAATALEFAWRGIDGYQTGELTLDLPAALEADQDIRMKVALMDVNDDSRQVVLSAAAGDVEVETTVRGANQGERLNIQELTLEGVPAGTEQVTITVTSPTSNGDSVFLVGASAWYACDQPDPYPGPTEVTATPEPTTEPATPTAEPVTPTAVPTPTPTTEIEPT